MRWWYLSAVANLVILVAYLAIAVTIMRGLLRSQGGWRGNPLALATAAIFFTCAVHHGAHPVHMLLPELLDADPHVGHAMQDAFDEWHLAGWDAITAAVGVWYWTLRSRFPALVHGSALFEDLRQRQMQALEIHDNVVQGLTTAKLSFELGEHERGLESVERTLAASRDIITRLLGDDLKGTGLGAGDLRRSEAAGGQ